MNQDVVFCSQEMEEVYEMARQYAQYSTTIMIIGETGVGKEIVANTIHKYSPRSNMPFIKINCTAIPESLLDSELFGYEGGAFTGASTKGRIGIFESAHKGSLLLDEVGELSSLLQTKLLRVLQEHEVRRVGGSWSKSVDVRIIACTNANMVDYVKTGQFRKDLFYRLNIATIEIPPLRERKADILLLLEHFLHEYCNKYNFRRVFNEDALLVILGHDFPGNVRELKNIVESSYITAKNDIIAVDSLPKYLINTNENGLSLSEQLCKYEKIIISNTLSCTDSVHEAAHILNTSYSTLIRRIEKYNLKNVASHLEF